MTKLAAIVILGLGFAVLARAESDAKLVASKPEKVAFLCEIDESSEAAKTDKRLLRFMFDSERFPVVGDPRKSLMSHNVWLDDGRDVTIVEIDETGESVIKWLPKFLQRTDNQPRHFIMSISSNDAKSEPLEIAHIPVEELISTSGPEKDIPIGRVGKGDLTWLLKCRQL